MSSFAKKAVAALATLSLGACAAHNPKTWEPPQLVKTSPVKKRLSVLPPPGQRVAIAVYGFTDQTGQFKPSDTVQTLSRAVTQGATSVLVKTLQDTGNRNWFQVIERERLDNVLRERAVIREMRATYLGEKQLNRNALPPLLFAGVLLEGGIIGYDSNTKTGGAGARFLGIGASTQYREDTVTIYLRAVSVKTGEVLSSVSVRKSIAAVSIGANAFRFVDFKELLELETGVAYNEPDQIALTQAIEKAVYALIMEGALTNLWCFKSSGTGYEETLIKEYLAERDSIKEEDVQMPFARDGSRASVSCATNTAVSSISASQLVPIRNAAVPAAAPKPTANAAQPNIVAMKQQPTPVGVAPAASLKAPQPAAPSPAVVARPTPKPATTSPSAVVAKSTVTPNSGAAPKATPNVSVKPKPTPVVAKEPASIETSAKVTTKPAAQSTQAASPSVASAPTMKKSSYQNLAELALATRPSPPKRDLIMKSGAKVSPAVSISNPVTNEAVASVTPKDEEVAPPS